MSATLCENKEVNSTTWPNNAWREVPYRRTAWALKFQNLKSKVHVISADSQRPDRYYLMMKLVTASAAMQTERWRLSE